MHISQFEVFSNKDGIALTVECKSPTDRNKNGRDMITRVYSPTDICNWVIEFEN